MHHSATNRRHEALGIKHLQLKLRKLRHNRQGNEAWMMIWDRMTKKPVPLMPLNATNH